jgi:SHS2 domain-containing protein
MSWNRPIFLKADGIMSKESLPESSKTSQCIGFEEIEHTADWALRVYGRDLHELYLNAARGMNALMVSEISVSNPEVERHVELEALDAESLLVEWLSELAYWAEAEMLIFHQFDLLLATSTHLEAIARGNYVSNLKKHIKAVTYHNLEISETDTGLETTIVFDV